MVICRKVKKVRRAADVPPHFLSHLQKGLYDGHAEMIRGDVYDYIYVSLLISFSGLANEASEGDAATQHTNLLKI